MKDQRRIPLEKVVNRKGYCYMKNEKLIKEWMDFAKMDYLTAKHLYGNMYPKPLEIICYHCQQSIEKLLKGVLITKGGDSQENA